MKIEFVLLDKVFYFHISISQLVCIYKTFIILIGTY